MNTLQFLTQIKMDISRVSDDLEIWPLSSKEDKLFGTEVLSSLRFVKSPYPMQQKTVAESAIENSNLLNMPPRFENKTDSQGKNPKRATKMKVKSLQKSLKNSQGCCKSLQARRLHGCGSFYRILQTLQTLQDAAGSRSF